MKKVKFPVRISNNPDEPRWLTSDGDLFYYKEYADEDQEDIDEGIKVSKSKS